MSWFQSTNLASFAKTALKEAQKTIDKALDINEEEDGGATRNNQTGGISRSITSATGMASDFFASWGVGEGSDSTTNNASGTNLKSTSSPSTTAVSSSQDSIKSIISSGTRSSDSVSVKKSAISPNRTSTSSVVHEFQNDGYGNNEDGEIIASNERTDTGTELNVSPFSSSALLMSSSSPQLFPVTTDESLNENLKPSTSNNSGESGFSKCDFESGELVQCLDDDFSTANKANEEFEQQRPGSPFSSNSNSSSATTLKFQSSSTTSSSIGGDAAVAGKDKDDKLISLFEEAAHTAVAANLVREKEEAIPKGNVELLQEIDLNGGNEGNWSEDVERKKGERGMTTTEATLSSSSYVSNNAVIESSLSDGWDWTSGTESYLNPGLNRYSTSNDEIKTTDKDVQQEKAENSSKVEDISASQEIQENLLTLSSCPVIRNSNVEPVNASFHQEELSNTATETQQEVTPSIPNDDSAPNVGLPDSIHNPLSSSSPTPCDNSSRSTHQQEQGHSIIPEQEKDSTTTSFEMVSDSLAGCNNPPQPESSRSSSIVVVSGRDSTPNSRGTSGAGSSGSSEGGHDHDDVVVDGRIRRHKKGASSSSSSDIEVIPSDYSSSSPALAEPDTGMALMSTSPLKKASVQTQSSIKEQRDCEVQTDQAEEQNTNSLVSEEEMSKFVTTKVADILAEKEQEVQQLREEGEKLSVKQFELSQVIKKLRAKEKETEGVVKGLRTEMATKNLELEKIMKTFISKEGIEQTQNDTISKLSQERARLELKVEQLNSDLEDAKDNVESMKATVENASIEILELKNVISSVQRESAEVDRLTREKAELVSRTESLQKEVDHLRSVLNTSQSSHHSREAELRSEISVLTQKFHRLENSLSDISSEVADATMPLSMEIEKLQGELKQQAHQFDRREYAMQSTISDLELKLTTASEREKIAKDTQMKYQSQNSTLELRMEDLETENRNLKEQLLQKEEIFKKKSDDKAAHYRKLEKTVERLTGEVERLSSENTELANELQTERTSLEAEVRRNQSLLMDNNSNREGNTIFDQTHHRPLHNAYHKRTSSMSTTASSNAGSQHSSSQRTTMAHDDAHNRSCEHSPSDHSVTYDENSYLDEVFDPNTGMMIGGGADNLNNRSMTPKSFFESFSSANLIENLQGQLRLCEGELVALQEKLSKNERMRKQLNEEIASLTMQNQQLEVEMEKMNEMQSKLDDLDKNYNAVLQMYGEKVEEADELRMDLDDVKEMYKNQIEQLLKKS